MGSRRYGNGPGAWWLCELPERVLPGVEHVSDDLIHAYAVLDLGKQEGAVASHAPGITVHHGKIGADGGRQVGLVDHEQVGLSDPRAALARDLIAAGNIYDLDGVIGQFTAETGGQVIAAGLEQEQIAMMDLLEFLQRE